MRRFTWIAFALLACGPVDRAFGPDPSGDMAPLGHLIAQHFDTTNGAVVAVDPAAACPADDPSCGASEAFVLARGFAEATGATVVSPGSADRPQCRWSDSTVEGKGLLVRFGPAESLEDTVRLRVYSTCRTSRWSFRQSHEFVFRWRRGVGWEFVAAPLVFIT